MSSGTSMIRRIELVLVAIFLFTIALPAAQAAVLNYEFSNHPTAEPVPMIGYARGAVWDGGTGGGTPYGFAIPGTGLQGDGTAIFADGPGESSNSGFVYNGLTGALTVEFRVKVLENVDQDAGRSMAYTQGTSGGGNGRGLQLDTNALIVVVNFQLTTFPVDFTQYQLIRISLPGDSTASFYRYNGSSWDSLGPAVTSFGCTGVPSEQCGSGGFSIGSLSGSGTQSGKIQLDYVRIENANALGGTGNPLPGPGNLCAQAVSPLAAAAVTGYAGGAAYPFASIEMGATDVNDGITAVQDCCDGSNEPAFKGGRFCHKNSDPPGTNNFMYFAVDDARVFNGSIPAVTMAVSYFDEGTETLNIEYDGAGSPFTGMALVTLTNSMTWKTATVNIPDAKFANSENGGADFRISGDGVATFYLDTITIAQTGTNGPKVNYTLLNAGTDTWNWSVSEVNCDGSAHDYPWLSAAPASGTNLAGNTSTQILATTNTTSLSAGLQTGYLKFSRTCSLAGCLSDLFTNPGGGACVDPGIPASPSETNFYGEPCLVGQNGWTSNTFHYSAISITSGNELRLNGGGDSSGNGNQFAAHTTGCTGSTVSVKVDAKTGGGGNDNNFWIFRAYDSGGNNLGLWQGKLNSVEAKNPADAGQATSTALTVSYKTLEMRINAGCRTTDYYVDADASGPNPPVLLVSYPWPAAASGSVANVEFQVIAGRSTSATDFVLLDNLSVTATTDDIRRIDLNVVGCSILVLEPRIRSVGHCVDTNITTEEFTIKNNGAFAWAGFTAAQVVTARPWLSIPPFTSGPVPVGGSAIVTATINWSQVTASEGARIQFGADCGSGPVFDTPSVGGGIETINVAAPNSPALFKIAYTGQFDKMPTDTSSAGVGYRFQIAQGTEQGSVTDDPSDTNPSDHKYYQLVDQAGGSTLMRLITDGGGNVPITGTTGATVVARLRTESFPTIGSSPAQNLLIFHDTIAAGIRWDSTRSLMTESFRGANVVIANDNAYHIVRITCVDVPGIGIIEKVYIDENPAPVMVLQPAGNQNAGLGSSPTVAGVGFGTSSGSAVQTIWYDWVSGTNAGAFAPGEENDCIGSLMPPNTCAHNVLTEAWADTDHDGDVDQDDFALYQICFTGPFGSIPVNAPVYCACMDRNNDGRIAEADRIAFENCRTAPGLKWTQALTPSCVNTP